MKQLAQRATIAGLGYVVIAVVVTIDRLGRAWGAEEEQHDRDFYGQR